MDKVITSLTVLLTGFVVVFLVLFLLILIIMAYGKIITTAEKKAKAVKGKKAAKAAELQPEQPLPVSQPKQSNAAAEDSAEISDDIIAVIAAAVDSVYGQGTSSHIKSVSRTGTRNAWGSAGVYRNTRPF